jgi:murein DD-endopeptidase MepM/ murein hydrolase activator NlpD
MESLFAYEMVKAMRATAGGPATGNGFGGEVYGSLFDMELAKIIAARGLGLQDLVVKGLGRAGPGQANADPSAAEKSPLEAMPTSALKNDTNQSVIGSTGFPSGRGALAPPVRVEAVPHTHEPLPPVEGGPDTVPAAQGTPPAAPPLPEALFPIREGGRVSSGFGYRKDPFTGRFKFHHGVDIAAADGTAVHPAKGGEVTFSGYQKGYGNVVVVDHGDGFVTKYAHNRANRVAAGDRVGPDTVIAEVGSTGRSTGPHLHFEVRYEGKQVHPEAVFAGIAKGNG